MDKKDNIFVTEQAGKRVVRPEVTRGCAFWGTFLVLSLVLGGIGSILFPVGTIVGLVAAWLIAKYAQRENANIDAVVKAAKDVSALTASPSPQDKIERLRLLEGMKERGTLTDDEFQSEKAKLLDN